MQVFVVRMSLIANIMFCLSRLFRSYISLNALGKLFFVIVTFSGKLHLCFHNLNICLNEIVLRYLWENVDYNVSLHVLSISRLQGCSIFSNFLLYSASQPAFNNDN